MSERGLLLALQRLHDDPGFVNLVSADPQNTLGIYDLDETECQALIGAVTNRDDDTLREMASKVGIDWTADHISGAGALSASEDNFEGKPVSPFHQGDINVSAFGADWVTGQTQSGSTSDDIAEDPSGLPIKRAGG
jgi:hypothetical protein